MTRFGRPTYTTMCHAKNTHYIWIKNLSALIQSQTTTHRSKKYICDRCLSCFYKEEKLQAHIVCCENQNHVRRIMPIKWNRENIVEFKNFENTLEVPFIVYADIESILQPITSENSASTSKAIPKGATKRHIPISIGYQFLSRTDPIQIPGNYAVLLTQNAI